MLGAVQDGADTEGLFTVMINTKSDHVNEAFAVTTAKEMLSHGRTNVLMGDNLTKKSKWKEGKVEHLKDSQN